MRHVAAAITFVVLAAGAASGKALQPKSDTQINGDCRRLQVYGHNTNSPCDTSLDIYELVNGRVGIAFKSQNGQYYWFLGSSRNEISPDEDTIFLAVDGVRVAGDRSGEDQKAIGMCSYGNPYLGSLHVRCHAETMEGPVDGEFISDGKQPNYH